MALTKIGKEGITGISNSADATFLTATSGEGVTLAGTLAVTGTTTLSTKLATSNLGAGAILQVVTADDSTARTSTSTSYVTASNTLAVAITPSATSSKIFVTASLGYRTPTGTVSLNITLYRGSTNLGVAAGFSNVFSGHSYMYGQATPQILDSPSSTSELTYQVYFKIGSGSNVGGINTGKSTITAYEIAG